MRYRTLPGTGPRERGLRTCGFALGIAIGLGCVVAQCCAVRARRNAEERVRQMIERLEQTPHSRRPTGRAPGAPGSELAASLDPADVIDRTLDAVVALPASMPR